LSTAARTGSTQISGDETSSSDSHPKRSNLGKALNKTGVEAESSEPNEAVINRVRPGSSEGLGRERKELTGRGKFEE
jgi:hypothetical protein